jgi:hypothetical protein
MIRHRIVGVLFALRSLQLPDDDPAAGAEGGGDEIRRCPRDTLLRLSLRRNAWHRSATPARNVVDIPHPSATI